MVFIRLMVIIPLMRMFMLLEELCDLSVMSAEETLRYRKAQRRRDAELERRQEETAWRKQQEQEEQARKSLAGQFPFEQKAALERLSRQGWPDGELGQVRNSAWRWFNSEPRYIEMALWPAGNGVKLGSDGNLWYDSAHVSVEHGHFTPFDLTEQPSGNLGLFLTYITRLGA